MQQTYTLHFLRRQKSLLNKNKPSIYLWIFKQFKTFVFLSLFSSDVTYSKTGWEEVNQFYKEKNQFFRILRFPILFRVIAINIKVPIVFFLSFSFNACLKT